MHPSGALADARTTLLTTVHEQLDDAFPRSGSSLEGTGFTERGGVVAYRNGETAVVRRDDGFIMTADGRQYNLSDTAPVRAGSACWPTSVLADALGSHLGVFAALGVDGDGVAAIEQACESAVSVIDSISVTHDNLREWVLNGNIDVLESTCPVTLPETRREFERNQGSFGDEFPPIARTFVYGTTGREVAYEDTDVALITGHHRDETWAVLLGIDDGGPFIHPMPESLRLSSLSYSVDRADIRDILGYDERWTPDTNLTSGTRYRVQGDLLMHYVSPEDVLETYVDSAFASETGDEVYDELGVPEEVRPYVAFDTGSQWRRGTPSVSIVMRDYVPTGDENLLKADINALLPDALSLPISEESVQHAILNLVDVGEKATELLYDDIDGPKEDIPLPLDNHMVFISEGHREPFNWQNASRLFGNTNRGRTYVYCPDDTTMTIEHKEHDQIVAEIPAGVYLFTLQRRR